MIDTHTHLYMDTFAADAADGCAQAVDRAVEAGVESMIIPTVDRESATEAARLHAARPGHVYTAMGLHPTEVDADWKQELSDIIRTLEPTSPVAIGEVGIDLYWDQSNLDLQKEAFTAQIIIGAGRGLPVIIHCREGLEECLECIRKAEASTGSRPLPTLIFHSFTGSPDDVKRIREVCDPYFGINGVVTFKNSGRLPDAVKEIGPDRLLLETDSPYLAPVPKRGRRNESSLLPYINEKIAEILGLSPEDTERITTRNANQIFTI